MHRLLRRGSEAAGPQPAQLRAQTSSGSPPALARHAGGKAPARLRRCAQSLPLPLRFLFQSVFCPQALSQIFSDSSRCCSECPWYFCLSQTLLCCSSKRWLTHLIHPCRCLVSQGRLGAAARAGLADRALLPSLCFQTEQLPSPSLGRNGRVASTHVPLTRPDPACHSNN